VNVTPLAPFGAEITDVSLDAIDPAAAATLATVIAENRVVVFRDQTVDDAGFTRFLGMFGALTFTAGETPVPGAPMLNIVSNVGRTTPPRSVFHTDTSYVERPPAFTALRAVALPGSGGATLFSDQVAALAGLPPRIAAQLAGRTLRHRATGLDGRDEACIQPLLRRHPLTGATALYLSTPERCSNLSGTSAETGARIVRALYRRSTRRATLYSHDWRDGDVVMWDNRVTMHRADHSEVAGDRVLHRGMTLGEVPIPA